MSDETEDKKGIGARLEKLIATYKKSFIGGAFIVLLAVAGGFTKLVDAYNKGEPIVTNALHPFQKDQEAIESLVLGDVVQSVNGKLGEPQQEVDVCASMHICESTDRHKPVLNIYRHENYTVRAVFDGDRLEFYAVTRKLEKYKPHIKNPYDLGEMGDRSYKETTFNAAPIDVDIFVRNPASYAEVTLTGAPLFQGLVLGCAPTGYTDEQSWDTEGAQALGEAPGPSTRPEETQERVAAAERFRAASRPNTEGFFNFDGYVGGLLNSAQNARALISEGSER